MKEICSKIYRYIQFPKIALKTCFCLRQSPDHGTVEVVAVVVGTIFNFLFCKRTFVGNMDVNVMYNAIFGI